MSAERKYVNVIDPFFKMVGVDLYVMTGRSQRFGHDLRSDTLVYEDR